MRRTFLLVPVLLATAALAGCSGDDPADPGDPTGTAAPAWNPCSGFDADATAVRLGDYSVRRGTPDAPTCAFVPQTEGEPTYEVNYQTYPGTLEELFDTFGDAFDDSTAVTAPRVAGTTDARVVVDTSDDEFLNVSGFVRNGVLVQVVNAIAPVPAEQGDVVRAVRALMADLAQGAASSGLTGSGSGSGSGTPSASPTA